MLHIILGILKIIGIILIGLIGIILLILTLVLFFPVGYQAKGEKYDDDITAKGKIYWLFHMVAFHISYENRELNTRLRILGIPVDFMKKNNNKEKKVYKKKREDKNKSLVKENESKDKELGKKLNEETIEKIKDEKNKGYNKEIGKEVSEDNDEVEKRIRNLPEKIEGIQEKKENINENKTKRNPIINFFKKLAAQIKKVFSNIKNIKFTFEKIYDKIISGKEKAGKIARFLKDENNKAGFKTIKKQFQVLWKHIKPRKLQLETRFGTGDPATTGQILGIISIAYPIFQNHCNITPDFEEQVFEGNLFLKGRIQAGVLVWIAFTLYRDRNIKKMISQLRIIRRK